MCIRRGWWGRIFDRPVDGEAAFVGGGVDACLANDSFEDGDVFVFSGGELVAYR